MSELSDILSQDDDGVLHCCGDYEQLALVKVKGFVMAELAAALKQGMNADQAVILFKEKVENW